MNFYNGLIKGLASPKWIIWAESKERSSSEKRKNCYPNIQYLYFHISTNLTDELIITPFDHISGCEDYTLKIFLVCKYFSLKTFDVINMSCYEFIIVLNIFKTKKYAKLFIVI